MHINRLTIIGIVMILLGVLITLVNSLDQIVLQLTYPFLMGSSEGKAIIFFFLMGSMLVLSHLMNNSKYMRNSRISSKHGNYYLKLVIILVFCTLYWDCYLKYGSELNLECQYSQLLYQHLLL